MNRTIDYGAALRRHALTAISVAVATIIVTIVITATQKKVFESSAQLVVSPSAQTMDTSDVIRSVETLERRTVVATFARFASTAETRNLAARRAGIPPEELAQYATHGAVMPSTNIIRVEATGPDAVRVAAMANAAALIAAEQARLLYRVYTLQIVSQAAPPVAPAYPDRKRNLLVGLTLAVFLGVLSAIAADRFRGAAQRNASP